VTVIAELVAGLVIVERGDLAHRPPVGGSHLVVMQRPWMTNRRAPELQRAVQVLEGGNLVYRDRDKDALKVGGENVAPAEIEGRLRELPGVIDVAVVGLPDERLGEVGAAFVVLRAPATPAELLAWSKEQMANYKVPRVVWVESELPRNASGKVLKQELRALARERLRR
jgi:acyl-CoA synthetase (AMP-forming)/AMP-acid ligase II